MAVQYADSEVDGASQPLTKPVEDGSDMEAAGLALALWIFGGLGMASAATFGAEEVSL